MEGSKKFPPMEDSKLVSFQPLTRRDDFSHLCVDAITHIRIRFTMTNEENLNEKKKLTNLFCFLVKFKSFSFKLFFHLSEISRTKDINKREQKTT